MAYPTRPAPAPGELPPLDLRILASPIRQRRDPRFWVGGVFAIFVMSMLWAPLLRAHHPMGEVPLNRVHAVEELPPAMRPCYALALAGDANAMRTVGAMYCNGLTVPKDLREGIRWYRWAAAAGDPDAARDLADLGITLRN